MALKFTTTDKASEDTGVKIMVYGSAGAGKTTLCATAPNPLIISAERGLLSLRHVSVPVIEITTADQLDEAFEWCKGQAAANGIQTLCLDSISEITERILANEKSKTKDPRQAYGEMANRTIEKIKDFRDLYGFHVVVTAKQTVKVDPVTGAPKATPNTPGQQVGPDLPYLFDEVFHAYTDKDAKGKTFHALRTHASFNAEAKDRSGVLDEIEYPDLAHIIHKIQTTPPRSAAT